MTRLPGLLLLSFALLFSSLHAQTTSQAAETFSCGYHGEGFLVAKAQEFRSNAEAEQVVNDIVAVVGIRPNFRVQAASIDNAAAMVRGDQQYLLYNPTFIQTIIGSTSTNWSAISIMAHEIGHHLNGHTLKAGGSQPAMELEADDFSGFVLRKMGASLREAQAAMSLLASDYGSATHPAKYQRLKAIEQGWRRADEYLVQQSGTVTTPPSEPTAQRSSSGTTRPTQPQVEQPSTDHPAFAMYRVTLSVNPRNVYYITTQNYFVTVKDGKIYKLGKLKKTSNAAYPYAIAFQNSKDLLITKRGELYTQSGNSVGYLSRV